MQPVGAPCWCGPLVRPVGAAHVATCLRNLFAQPAAGWGACAVEGQVLAPAAAHSGTLQAIVYASKRPDPVPHVYGYHEASR